MCLQILISAYQLIGDHKLRERRYHLYIQIKHMHIQLAEFK